MQKKKNFIKINEAFICLNCKKAVSKADKTCRNHCPFCLYSLHEDTDIPGDRLSPCKGLMIPVEIEYNKKKGYVLIHQCNNCGIKKRNMIHTDDSINVITSLVVATNAKRAKNAGLK